MGRFIQRDSLVGQLQNPQSLNRYVYAENNPVKYTDPSGLYGELELAGLGMTQLDSPLPGPADIIGLGVFTAGLVYDAYTGISMGIGWLLSQANDDDRASTDLGKKWRDFQKNPGNWEKVDEKYDPKQPTGGESVRSGEIKNQARK